VAEEPTNQGVGDKKVVKRRKEADKVAVLRRDAALRGLLEHKEGRELLWFWLSKTGMFHSAGPMSAENANYRNGQADFGRFMLADVLRSHPQAYIMMHTEAGEATVKDEIDGNG
jgi:hypothetical protein